MDTPPPLSPDPSANPPMLDAVATRKAHLNHEASLQSLGVLYYLGATFSILAAIVRMAEPGPVVERWVVPLVLIVLGIAQGVTAGWLRALDPRARTPAILFSAIGLLGFPIGTILAAYILYLLLSKKGRYVFTPEYKAVIAATPEIKYKTSIVVLILAAVVVILLVGAIVLTIGTKHG